MKKFIIYLSLILVSSLALTLCTKNEINPVKMNYEEVSKLIGRDNAFEVFDKAGLTEVETSEDGTTLRGSKKVKAGAAVAVWVGDLDLFANPETGVITYSTVPDANFTGVTKFLTQTSNDGALGIWSCNRYYATPAQVEPIVTCSDSNISGWNLRAFTSNSTTGDIHVSEFVVVP